MEWTEKHPVPHQKAEKTVKQGNRNPGVRCIGISNIIVELLKLRLLTITIVVIWMPLLKYKVDYISGQLLSLVTQK